MDPHGPEDCPVMPKGCQPRWAGYTRNASQSHFPLRRAIRAVPRFEVISPSLKRASVSTRARSDPRKRMLVTSRENRLVLGHFEIPSLVTFAIESRPTNRVYRRFERCNGLADGSLIRRAGLRQCWSRRGQQQPKCQRGRSHHAETPAGCCWPGAGITPSCTMSPNTS
jgi:hypothetical protein